MKKKSMMMLAMLTQSVNHGNVKMLFNSANTPNSRNGIVTRRVFVIVLTITSFVLNAKSQGWVSNLHKADELRGTKEYISYTFTDDENNMFIFWSDNKNNFRIINAEGIFRGDKINHMKVKIGYYDENDKLVEQGNKKLAIDDENYSRAETFNLIGGGKILKFIQEENGYVRILAPQYKAIAPWEIRVPCMRNGKTN